MPITTPWTTETIGASNITEGDASSLLRWRRNSGTVEFAIQFVFGSSTTVDAPGPRFVLPVDIFQAPGWAQVSADSGYRVGAVPCIAYDADTNAGYGGSASVLLTPAVVESGQPVGSAGGSASPYFGSGRMSATVPFTWAVGDVLVIGNALEAFGN